MSSLYKTKISSDPAPFCVDIGASRSVFRFLDLKKIYGEAFPSLQPSKNNFRFGNQVELSIGAVCLFLGTPPFIRVILVRADVASVDVPPLLRLDVLDLLLLVADTVTNRLVKLRIL